MEATVVLVDNSEWMRNGDFIPSRLIAQQDAVSLLSNAKTSQHAENTIAIISTGGARSL